MNFISYNNPIELDCIDFKNDLICVSYNNSFFTYSWVGEVTYKMDYDTTLGGAYVDSNHNIKLTFIPDQFDTDKEALKYVEDNHEWVIEHIVQQTYIKEMGKQEISYV